MNTVVERGPAGGRAVALTYDDGPGRSTGSVLDLLADAEVKATFFFVGSEVERHPGVARRIVAEGHTVGSHTLSHLDHHEVPAEKAVADMLAGADAIARAIGFEPTFYRAPYGHFVPATVAEAERRGWTCVRWSALGFDWTEEATPRSVADHVLEDLEPGAIVLLHDSRRAKPMDPEPVVGATKILLEEVERRGLHAVSVGEML